MVLYEILADHGNRSNHFNFQSFLNGFVWNPTITMQIEATFSNFDYAFWKIFEINPTGPQKSKQPFQFWLAFEWYLCKILLDHANRSNFFNFDWFLNGLCMEYYQTTKIDSTFSILTHFWMAFVWNPTRQRQSKQLTCSNLTRFWMVFETNRPGKRKSKQPFQFWPIVEWFLYEILLDHANQSNLFKFDSFLNGFVWCPTIDYPNRSNLFKFDSFLNVSVWNPTRPRQSKQSFQIWLVFEWFCMMSYYRLPKSKQPFQIWLVFECFCMKSY